MAIINKSRQNRCGGVVERSFFGGIGGHRQNKQQHITGNHQRCCCCCCNRIALKILHGTVVVLLSTLFVTWNLYLSTSTSTSQSSSSTTTTANRQTAPSYTSRSRHRNQHPDGQQKQLPQQQLQQQYDHHQQQQQQQQQQAQKRNEIGIFDELAADSSIHDVADPMFPSSVEIRRMIDKVYEESKNAVVAKRRRLLQQRGSSNIHREEPCRSMREMHSKNSENATAAPAVGIYHVAMGDRKGGVGTALIQLVLGQIMYAYDNQLIPWIHFIDNTSEVIYDPHVHFVDHNSDATAAMTTTEFRAWTGRTVTRMDRGPYGHWRDISPGPLAPSSTQQQERGEQSKTFRFEGTTGIWEHYFEPIWDPYVAFSEAGTGNENDNDLSKCFGDDGANTNRKLYYVTMEESLINPGIHGYSTKYSTRCWRYQYLPEYITKPYQPLNTWLGKERQRASDAIRRYPIRIKPYIRNAATFVNRDCFLNSTHACLGMHIRHSDKAAKRRIVPVSEFLPYALQFVTNGGTYIYLATDSTHVLDEIRSSWPLDIVRRIRTLNGPVLPRQTIEATNDDSGNEKVAAATLSNDTTAVFDLVGVGHHRTNLEALIEIMALSQCQFLVHGLSALSEAAIWFNIGLHRRSVNVEEDPIYNMHYNEEFDHIKKDIKGNKIMQSPQHTYTPEVFGTLVRMAIDGAPEATWPVPPNTEEWWNTRSFTKSQTAIEYVPQDLSQSCEEYGGVLLINTVGKGSSTGMSFFTDVLNQLIYAEKHRLIPYIHLGEHNTLIYDTNVHRSNNGTSGPATRTLTTLLVDDSQSDTPHGSESECHPMGIHAGEPVARALTLQSKEEYRVEGSGVWNDYFRPVRYKSSFRSLALPNGVTVSSCAGKPLIQIRRSLILSGLDAVCPWYVRPWRSDHVPDSMWWEPFAEQHTDENAVSYKTWIEPMRIQAHEIVRKYYRFQPYLVERAEQVNPVTRRSDGGAITNTPCLAVHFRNGDKSGKYRRKVKADEYKPYLEAFVDAGGPSIYIASDSNKPLQYMEKNFPSRIWSKVHSQGKYVIRTYKDYPTHFIAGEEDHHRMNSETLVDILAMSKCQFLLHTRSTVAEATIYLNLNLHNHSINLEDPKRPSPEQFKKTIGIALKAS